MKKILITLLLFFLYVSQAWGVILIQNTGSCATPFDGSNWNEGFLGAGYEETWSEGETVGASGGVVDEDFTLSGSPPSGSCSEGLNIIATLAGDDSYVRHSYGSALSLPVDIEAEFYIDAVTIPTGGNTIALIQGYDASWLANQLQLKNSTGTTFLEVQSSTTSASMSVSLDTWHTVKIHLDSTAASSYVQLDGGAQNTFTRNGAPKHFYVGASGVSASEEIDIEIGRVWW